MVKPNRKRIGYMALALFSLTAAYFLRFMPSGIFTVTGVGGTAINGFSIIRAGIYIGFLILWSLSVHYRVIHPQVRRLFGALSVLMICWMLLRTIKFEIPGYPDLRRYFWYLYYIPMLFIPLLAFLISMWLGRPEGYRLPNWTRWLYLTAAALALLVLSNDFHQKVFVFPGAVRGHSDNDGYSYGVLFGVVFGWRCLGLLITVAMIFVRSHALQGPKWLALPLLPSAILLLYGIALVFGISWITNLFADVTVTECLYVAAILECCLQCGLIQSNTYYAELFETFGYPSVIVDEEYVPVFTSGAFVPISKEQMRQAENGPVELREGLLLKSIPVKNGHILWTENITELLALKAQADAMTKELTEEKELLRAEIDMKQKQAVLMMRNRLYDSVVQEISPQFAEIDRLVSLPCENREERKTAMRRMCVIGAYIKRRCNLLFLEEENPEISSEELVYCFRESADYIRFYGAECSLYAVRTEKIPIGYAILTYDLFEKAVETALTTLSAMLICLEPEKNGLTLKLQIEGGTEQVDFSGWEPQLQKKNGRVEELYEEGVLYLKVVLPKGDVE